jgi:serine/threonine protein kinase
MTYFKSGYLGKKYDSDYAADIKTYQSLTLEQKLSDFHQLLFGLKYLADQGILHGDLKPENVFVKKGKTIKRVHIADLGGACRVNSKSPLIEDNFHFGRGYTPSYAPKTDMDLADKFITKHDKKNLVEVEKKRDVFAMGFILYQALSAGRPPFKFNSMTGHPLLLTYQEIKDKSIPKEIRDLIKEMLNADYKARPTAAEAFNRLNDYISKNHPKLHDKLEKEIQRGYPGSNG